MIKRCLGVLAAAIVALGITAPKAEAVVIYDWTGTCSFGCTGEATAVLTLADSYTPGTLASTADFISFSYSSSSGSYDIPADAAFSSIGGPAILPAVSGTAEFNMSFAGARTDFISRVGSWFSQFDPSFDPNGAILNTGSDNTWTLRQPTELSAPGPLSLFALGFAGLALAGRRRKQG